jgi:4-amino-4-deoxy-L-arabinose transferase-like glycosyltransferase
MIWLKKHYDRVLLTLILLLSAYLTGYKIWMSGDANAYYTATVTSMLKSWHNFFFASFDPGGFITVDKPALGFWLQCLFGLVFGVHGWSLALPEVLCSVASVAVIYRIVARSSGKAAGLLAAFFLSLTPIFVAATRSNNLDASLVLVCLLALWAVLAAAEKGSLKLLLLAAVLLGVGFNIKMLQAYFYVPALYLVYFFTAKAAAKKRALHLLAATAVLLAVSLSWSLAVDLTPASERPYVGSSATNSALELAIGYNGLARVVGAGFRAEASSALNTVFSFNSGVPNEGGAAGFFRLFNREMAGQLSWFIIPSLFGLAALALRLLSKAEADKKDVLRQLLAWLGLLVPMAAFFSISGHFHRYYMIMLAPVTAALSAIAAVDFLRYFKAGGEKGGFSWKRLLLPAALILTAASEIAILSTDYAAYAKVFVPIIVICCIVCLALLASAVIWGKGRAVLVTLAVAVGLAGFLSAPAYWAYCPILYGGSAAIPYAGPPELGSIGPWGWHGDGAPQNVAPHFGGATQPKPGASALPKPGVFYDGPPGGMNAMNQAGYMGFSSDAVIDYMIGHQSGGRFLAAVPNAAVAEPIIIKYGAGVMALGGFRGSDNAIRLEDFIALVHRGDVQYFWAIGYTSGKISQWVQKNGVKIEPSAWGGKAGIGALYDLSSLKTG